MKEKEPTKLTGKKQGATTTNVGAGLVPAHPQRGITLIALVITIIVLLILAGVTIAMVLGPNGIIDRAKESKTKTEQASQNEQTDLAELQNKMESYLLEETIGKAEVDKKAGDNSTITGGAGSYQNPVVPKGFKPINQGEAIWGDGTSNPSYDKGLVIEDATNDATTKGSQFVWVPVSDYNDFIQKEGYVAGSEQNYLSLCNNERDLTTPEAIELFSSVKVNGGFYIARYEMGIDTTTTATTSEHNTLIDGSIKPVSKPSKGTWNYIPWGGSTVVEATDGFQGNDLADGAVKVARSMYPKLDKLADYNLPRNLNNETGATSTLIYGTQWDAAMTFLSDVTNPNASNKPYIQDSTGMGNYSGGGGLKTTGQYAVKNIYDLAGNVLEWTMEKYDSSNRVVRGGYYGDNGARFPVSERYNYDPAYNYATYGARVALYL